ncbi:MAG: imidazoleglycerol-phosphate dehydratase HisB [Alkalispirochaeta sp.]
MRTISVERTTRETSITIALNVPDSAGERPAGKEEISSATGVRFLDHMLEGMMFHGGFTGAVSAQGDTDIDDHHTVEDVGIVLGQAFRDLVETHGPVARFGHAVLPMDDSLAESIVDVSGRSYLVFRAEFPQAYAGHFDLALVREFFQGFANNAAINLHILGHYGVNGHHLAEAIFKSTGRALGAAYATSDTVRSTKGVL